MFSALESAWHQSARRGWTTLASFTMQALGLSLLLAIPILTIQGPPKLQWFGESPILTPPPAPAPPASGQRLVHSSNISGGHLLQPPTIPPTIATLNEPQVGSAPDLDNVGVQGGTGTSRRGIPGSIGIGVDVAPPPTPAPTHPLKISQWAEGNIIYRVQPVYPSLARLARVQGGVELRAIISKAGTIENLVVVRGHPMLAAAAIAAVRQWRYRPYLLNSEPIEVETEITVNFVLSGN
ncbi:MAG: energy transducer TonB [Terriglobales bacterium]|jgi:periplasmic protein TonB